MNLGGLKGIGDWVKLYYDKLLAVTMLLVLLASLVHLAARIGSLAEARLEHERRLEAFRPEHPEASAVSGTVYRAALGRLEEPFQVAVETNLLFVPETRVWCTECRMPIPIDAEICPLCNAKVDQGPNPLLFDYDKDGIPNKWEIKLKLDPTDPKDALIDSDGDGFSNIQEFRAEPQTDLTDLSRQHGTDIHDPDDHPPLEDLLFVSDISGEEFKLRFQGKITLPDGSLKFQLNLRGDAKTYWVKLGDTVEGFTVVDFEPRTEKQDRGGVMLTVDLSVLTLKRGDELIPLTIDQKVPYKEYTARLEFALDGTTYPVKEGDTFALKGETYLVKSIDSQADRVVIVRKSDRQEFHVGRAPTAQTLPAER